MSSAKSVSASPYAKQYAAGAQHNVRDDGLALGLEEPRVLRPLADGTLVVKCKNPKTGALEDVTLTVSRDVDVPLAAYTIEAGTTVDVQVFW